MSFRGKGYFNTSLLLKHFWRLLTDEDSLFSKVFKSCYYPRSCIQEATISFGPSFVGRSNFSAKGLVIKRAHWRIRTRSKVNLER